MNISSSNKLSRKYIPDVKGSNYDFNRFDKAALKNIVSVLKLFIITESYSNWKEVDLFFRAIIERFYSDGLDVYCFIVSPYWKNNTRIARHYGLGRMLEKEFRLEPLKFLIEKEIVNDNDVIFYGVLKLSPTNARSIFHLLSANENGVLFSSQGSNDPGFNLIIDDLARIVSVKPKGLTCNLNIVEAVNIILDKGAEALFPHAWEETGEYNLDIFKSAEHLQAG